MKKYILSFAALLLISAQAQAAWWYLPFNEFPRVTINAQKHIILQRPFGKTTGFAMSSIYPTGDQGEGGTVGQLILIPPPGLENHYLTLILSAQASKRRLYFSGHLPSNSSEITADKVEVE